MYPKQVTSDGRYTTRLPRASNMHRIPLQRHSINIGMRLERLIKNISKLKADLSMYDIDKKLKVLKL